MIAWLFVKQYDEITLSNKITYFSFFLSICVVFLHANNVEIYGINEGNFLVFVESYNSSFFSVCVPSFFCLSGYLFYRNVSKTILLEKIKRRFFSLVIPYIVWSSIGFLYFFFLSIIPSISSTMNGKMGQLSFVSIVTDILASRYNVLWFLRNLIIFSLLTALLFYLLPYKHIFAVLFVTSFFLPQLISISVNDYNIFTGYNYYLFGVLLGLYFPNITKYKASKKISVISLLLSLFLPLILMNTTILYPYSDIINSFKILILWFSCDVFNFRKEPKWWHKLSFFTYVSHSLILESIEKLVLIFLGKTLIGMAIVIIFAPSFLF